MLTLSLPLFLPFVTDIEGRGGGGFHRAGTGGRGGGREGEREQGREGGKGGRRMRDLP
jgi:hypothetical protein